MLISFGILISLLSLSRCFISSLPSRAARLLKFAFANSYLIPGMLLLWLERAIFYYSQSSLNLQMDAIKFMFMINEWTEISNEYEGDIYLFERVSLSLGCCNFSSPLHSTSEIPSAFGQSSSCFHSRVCRPLLPRISALTIVTKTLGAYWRIHPARW